MHKPDDLCSFSAWNPHQGGRRPSVPQSHPLTSTQVLPTHVIHVHLCIHTHVHAILIINMGYYFNINEVIIGGVVDMAHWVKALGAQL